MKTIILAVAVAAAGFAQTAAAPKPSPTAAKSKPTAAASAKTTGARASAATVPSYKTLKFPPLREVRIPEVAQFTLANGMRVYLLENHELPLLGGFALVRTGNLFDPADKVGLAGMTGTVMRSGGTKAKTGDQLDEQLENIAAAVESSIGESSGTVSFRALKENTDDVLAVFKDVLLNPEFRQDKIDLAKTQMRAMIARRNDEASDIANRELTNTIYGRDNSYGWDIEYRHVDAIQRDDLIAFYKRYFFPSNIMLAVQGDFNTAEMRARIEKLFNDWNYKQPPVPEFPSVQRKQFAGVYFAEKDDVTQSFVEMGHLGGVLNAPDYPALSVMSDILGGGFASRLFKNVRTIKGLAYGIGGGWGATFDHPGIFRISGSTKSASTVDMIQAAKAEIEKIRTGEVTDPELETAKQSVLNSFVFNFDHPSKILNRLVTYDYYGYPKDFIFRYQKAVEGVTKADVLRVAKEHLKPETMAIVVAGNSKELGKPLNTLGAVTQIDLTIPDPKAAPAKSDSSSIERGKKLLQRAQQAAGGAEKLAAVKDSSAAGELQITTPDGPIQVKFSARFIAPTTLRQTQEFPFGTLETFYDGKTGWLASPQGVMDLPPPIAKQLQAELFRNQFSLLLSDRMPDRTVSAVGESSVQISDKSGNTVKVDMDPASGQVVRATYRGQNMQGEVTENTAHYSDFRDVNGYKLPFKILIEQDGKKFAEGGITENKVNTGLKLEDLAKKP